MEELTHEILHENRKHRWQTTVIATCCSVFITCCIAIGVTFWLTHQAQVDSIERGRFNCKIQKISRHESNRRAIYTKATKVVIEHFKPVEEWLKENHPELYPLPNIILLPEINCSKLPVG